VKWAVIVMPSINRHVASKVNWENQSSIALELLIQFFFTKAKYSTYDFWILSVQNLFKCCGSFAFPYFWFSPTSSRVNGISLFSQHKCLQNKHLVALGLPFVSLQLSTFSAISMANESCHFSHSFFEAYYFFRAILEINERVLCGGRSKSAFENGKICWGLLILWHLS
jgi:hypothetical protein